MLLTPKTQSTLNVMLVTATSVGFAVLASSEIPTTFLGWKHILASALAAALMAEFRLLRTVSSQALASAVIPGVELPAAVLSPQVSEPKGGEKTASSPAVGSSAPKP